MVSSRRLIIAAVFIFGISLLFRFWQVTAYPVSLTLDEVEIGYNAYSLLKTGRDSWKQPLPLVFKSVGDYKPPVNFYLTVPFIKFIGLTELAVRFPSALMGAFTPLVVLVLLRRFRFSLPASALGSFWLAVLPWHVHFSRAGFEAVTALFFLLLGLLAFVESLNRKSVRWMVISVIGFSLSVWAYHSSRVFVPLLSVFLILYFKTRLKYLFTPRKILTLAIPFLVLSLPFLHLALFTPAIRSRAESTSLIHDSSLARSLHYGQYAELSEKVFDNDIYLVWHHWLGKYIDYFDLRFWFWKGLGLTPPGYPDSGLFYLVDIPLLALGAYCLARKKFDFISALALFWLFAGPLAASLAANDQHSLRAMVWIPFFILLVASGLRRHNRVLTAVYTLFLTANIIYVSDLYFVQTFRYYSENWQYGFKDIALYSCAHKDQYDRIVISETFGSQGPVFSGIPYAYVLFYCTIDPLAYQTTREIDKFYFRRVKIPEDLKRPKSLLISSVWDYVDQPIPRDKIVKQIDYLNGLPAFIFVDSSK